MASARAWSLVLASVVRDVGLHMWVTPHAGEALDAFHAVASPLGPRALGPQMPLVLAGKKLRGRGHVDVRTHAISRFASRTTRGAPRPRRRRRARARGACANGAGHSHRALGALVTSESARRGRTARRRRICRDPPRARESNNGAPRCALVVGAERDVADGALGALLGERAGEGTGSVATGDGVRPPRRCHAQVAVRENEDREVTPSLVRDVRLRPELESRASPLRHRSSARARWRRGGSRPRAARWTPGRRAWPR